MPGLKINTPDYNYVYQKFWNEEYDVDNHDGEAIWKDHTMPHFRDEYDLKQFKQSLYRMVNRIKNDRNNDSPPAAARAPDPAPQATSTPPPSPPQEGINSPPAPTATPSVAGIPAPTEIVPNDEYILSLPNHLFGWKDSYENDRLTLMVFLPTGCSKADVYPWIVGGGTEVAIEYKWPNGMVDPRLPMFAGTRTGKAFYGIGHVKVVSFKESIRRLKDNDGERPIKSVFRKDLGRTVEEQFSDIDVPAALATVRYKLQGPLDENGMPTENTMEGICLVLEMMCLRTNYKTCEIEDFVLDFDSLQI